MKKVLWFSRHEMSEAQLDDLSRIFGDIEVTQVSRTINTAFELKDEIEAVDVVAIVAPINIQQQFIKLAGDKPVISAVSKRVLVPQADGTEDKVMFIFDYWQRLVRIDVVTERL